MLVAAVGVPRLVRGDWVKPGAAVIDVGVSEVDGVLVGDVDTEGVHGHRGARHAAPPRRRADDDHDAAAQHARAPTEPAAAHERRCGARRSTSRHRAAAAARMVEFAGFEMPVQYSSILEEHAAVRERRGPLRRLAHGPDRARRARPRSRPPTACSRGAIASLAVGPRALRAALQRRKAAWSTTSPSTASAPDALLLCVNAANIEKDCALDRAPLPARGAALRDHSDETGLLALQGPAAARVLARLADAGARLARAASPSRAGRSRAGRRWSRAPATPAPTASSSTAPRATPVAIFEALLARARPLGLRPGAGSARATPCASRPRCRSTATSSTTPPPRSRPGSGASSSSSAAASSAPRRSRARHAPATRARSSASSCSARGVARAGYPVAQGGRDGRPRDLGRRPPPPSENRSGWPTFRRAGRRRERRSRS